MTIENQNQSNTESENTTQAKPELEKPNLSRTELKKIKVQKLKEQAALLTKELKRIEAQEKYAAKKIQRTIENRLKNHIGGTVNMTGLLRYVYEDESLHDNPQDALIENLLAGVFWEAAYRLESLSIEELILLYETGYKFRSLKPSEREIPNTNKNLNELFSYLKKRNVDNKTKMIDSNIVDEEAKKID